MSSQPPKLPSDAPNPATPSNSVVLGAALGTPIVVIVAWVLDAFFKVPLPSEVSAAAGTLIGSAVAYFGNGGRAIHTQ